MVRRPAAERWKEEAGDERKESGPRHAEGHEGKQPVGTPPCARTRKLTRSPRSAAQTAGDQERLGPPRWAHAAPPAACAAGHSAEGAARP